ncbi:hypothetical protein GCM10023238_02520 [Streptomyces heliomycini]
MDGMLVTMWRLFEGLSGPSGGRGTAHRVGGRPEPQEPELLLDDRRQTRAQAGPGALPAVATGRDASARPWSSTPCSRPSPSGDDLYQMTAYCVRLGLTEGHLVYASGRSGVVEVPVGEDG